MPNPTSDPDDDIGKEGRPPDKPDNSIQDFHAANRKRKRALFENLAKGAAIGTGKEIAEKFIEWLSDNWPDWTG